jgi:hypothetical protein
MSEVRQSYTTDRVSISSCEFVTIMTGLTPDEADLIRRLRKMKAQRHQLAIVQFTEKGLQCREVGRLEG